MSKITMQIKSENISITEAFEQFIRFKKIQNLSDETILYYQRCQKKLGEYFALENNCNLIDEELFLGFVEYLQNQEPKIKDVTINSYLRGIRCMFKYYMEKGYIKRFSIKLMKTDKDIKETYTNEELVLLLKKPNIKTCTFVEYRTWAITNFFLGTGMRISSVLNIKIGDIDLDAYEVRVNKTKNRKQQMVPLSQALCKTIKEYLDFRGGEKEDYLFPNQFGKMLTKRGLQTSISIYNRRRGVDKTSAHVYRHTFAKHWILNGGDIFSLQKILGHSSLDIVKEYVNIFGVELKQQYNKFNPLDNFTQNQDNGSKIKMLKK